jgi:hypothetical protein
MFLISQSEGSVRRIGGREEPSNASVERNLQMRVARAVPKCGDVNTKQGGRQVLCVMAGARDESNR